MQRAGLLRPTARAHDTTTRRIRWPITSPDTRIPYVTLDWGRFVYFADPGGNTWSLQELPVRT
jgi:hypothetical protein